MTKPQDIEEHKDGAKRRDDALARALMMPPAPFTPKPTSGTKKKRVAKKK